MGDEEIPVNAVATSEGTLYVLDSEETRVKLNEACKRHFSMTFDQFAARWSDGGVEGDQQIARRIAMFIG
jgi:hypothetical protein